MYLFLYKYKDAVQGGHPPPPIVYLVPLAKSRAHGAASQTGIELGRFGSDRVIFCSTKGVFEKTPLLEQKIAPIRPKTPRLDARFDYLHRARAIMPEALNIQ